MPTRYHHTAPNRTNEIESPKSTDAQANRPQNSSDPRPARPKFTNTVPDLLQEFEEEKAAFRERFAPQNHLETRFVEFAAYASHRRKRLQRALKAHLWQQEHDARKKWKTDQWAGVLKNVQLLATSPRTAVKILRRSAKGSRFLARRWESLRAGLAHNGSLSAHECRIAFALLGHKDPPHATRDALANKLLRLLQALHAREETALARLQNFLKTQRDLHLERAKQLLEQVDRPARLQFLQRARETPNKTIASIKRDIAQATCWERQWIKSLNDLRKHDPVSQTTDDDEQS